MSDKKVILYSQPTCPPCHAAKAWLEETAIPFEVRDIRQNDQYLTELIKLGASATPAFLIGEEVVLGFNKNQIQSIWDTYSAS